MYKKHAFFWFVLAFFAGVGLAACSDDSQPKTACGNGVCDPDEAADTCPVDCGCGNGILNEGEECDGNELADQTCQSLGYQAGILSCSSRCTFDRSRCEGGAVCGNGFLEGGEECDGTDKGDATCADFGFDGGELGCDPSCHVETTSCCNDSCDQDGTTRCNGNILETCEIAATGCLAWQQTEDCARRQGTCTEGDDGFYCKYPCRDRCTEQGSHICDGDVLKVCDKAHPEDPEDCLDWLEEQDCAANNQYCGDRGDGPACITPLPGDSCLVPDVVTEFPYEISGDDFTQDFENLYNFSDPLCTTGRGAEVFFQVDLQQGEAIDITETGGLDAVLRVIDTCSATAVCLLSVDGPEDQRFQPTQPGTYLVVVEAYSTSPYSKDYSIHLTKGMVEVAEQSCTDDFDNDDNGATDCADSACAGSPPCEAEEATCDDGFDNDADGRTDCEDPTCFGQANCTSEANLCDDRLDNDADGATDCADTECQGQAPCETVEQTCDDGFDNDGDGLADCADPDCPMTGCMLAIYQEFDADDPIDLAGKHIRFTPDTNLRMNYALMADATGQPFPVTPGSGDSSRTLSLGDDDSESHTLSLMSGFDFFGQTYNTVHVVSNGYLAFASQSSTLDSDLSGFLAEVPKIAGMDRDLNPTHGGTITVDEFSHRLAITFEDVPRYSHDDQTVSFQIILSADGTVDIYYGDISIVLDGSIKAYVGITEGDPSKTQFPPETDLVP